MPQISRQLLRRVVVVGANGAGKTYVATRLATLLTVNVIHKDALALTVGWQQLPKSVVSDAIAAQITAPHWVLEGGPSVLTPDVLTRADLVIWLDVPGPLRFWRIIRRSLQYAGRVRPEHPPGNRDWPGLRQSRFAWRALTTGDAFARAIIASLDAARVPVLRLRSRRCVAEMFDVLSRQI